MPTLSSTIVKHQIASMRDVEEALARQVLYGGDLATNLLELAAVSEQALTGVLAESHELEPGPIGELPAAAETTRRLVPGDIALRHGFYPLEERGGMLVVAVSEPLVPEVEEDLAFALGVRIVQRAVPLVRIRQALARDYTVPLDRRTLRILAKLEGLPDPSPSSLPGPVRASGRDPGLAAPTLGATVRPRAAVRCSASAIVAPLAAPPRASPGTRTPPAARKRPRGDRTKAPAAPERSVARAVADSGVHARSETSARRRVAAAQKPPAAPRSVHRGDGRARPAGGLLARRRARAFFDFALAILRVFGAVRGSRGSRRGSRRERPRRRPRPGQRHRSAARSAERAGRGAPGGQMASASA